MKVARTAEVAVREVEESMAVERAALARVTAGAARATEVRACAHLYLPFQRLQLLGHLLPSRRHSSVPVLVLGLQARTQLPHHNLRRSQI